MPVHTNVPRLKDVMPPHPRLLLVGINPGLRSGAVGHHFAGNGNPFWKLLHASKLTPRLLHYEEDQKLGELGIALTNLCPRTTRSAAELTSAEIARGRRVLARKIATLRPGVVAFVGLSLYQQFFQLPRSGGAGAKPERISGAAVFVVPNPSGLNANFPGFKQKLIWFEALREFVSETLAERPAPSSSSSSSSSPSAIPGTRRRPTRRGRGRRRGRSRGRGRGASLAWRSSQGIM